MGVVEAGAPLEVVAVARDGLLEAQRSRRRARGRGAREVRVAAGREALAQLAQLAVAEASLARAHGRRRVALEQLGRAEALLDGALDLADGDVVADADVAVGSADLRLRAERGQLDALAACGRGADLAGVGDHLLDGARRDDVAACPDRLAVGLAQQVLLRCEAGGEREHVAREALGAASCERDRDGVDGLAPVRLLHGAAHDARALEAGVVGADGQHDRRDRRSLIAQGGGVRGRLVRAAEDDRVVADPDPVRGRQARGAAAEEDAGHLVAGEHDVLLERARRDHDRAWMHHVQQARADHRHLEPLVDADRGVRRRELDQRLAAGLGDQARDGLLDGARRELPAGLVLVDREHALAGSRGAERGRQPRRAEADHEHVGMQMRSLEIAGHVRQVDPAAAGDLADDRLDLRPRPLRLDQRLVVEARGERPVHAVVERERVALDARPGALALRRHAVARGAQAGAHVALAVDLEQAVGAVAGQAVEARGGGGT